MRANLDKAFVKALALPAGKRQEVFWDQALKGFGLRAQLDAEDRLLSSYVIQYRHEGRQCRVKLGDCAKLTPDQARKRATEMLAKVVLGVDPASEKRAATAAAVTLSSVVDLFLAAKERAVQSGARRVGTLRIMELYLRKGDYFRPLRSSGINSITRAHVATRLNSIIEASGASTASRCRAHLSALFAWAMKEGIAEANPVIGTNNPESAPREERVLDNSELATLWRACGEDNYGRVIRLLILTGARRGEIAKLRWSWIADDFSTLTIPGTVAKNHRALTLPLAPMAADILKAVPRRADRDCLFGQRGDGFIFQHGRPKVKLTKPWRLHDIRHSVVTGMAEIGIEPHIIEAIVNHVSGHKGGIAGKYNHASYSRQMKTALNMWADHIASITSGSERKVVNLQSVVKNY